MTVIFKGDLTTFDPPDLLMFLAHMGREGMLSVTRDAETLNIWIKKGIITGAFSGPSDDKLLRSLLVRRWITRQQLSQLHSIKKETGMPARQILEKLKLPIAEKFHTEMKNSLMEVLFQFCLMDRGDFQFVEVPVDMDSHEKGLPCPSLVLELTRQIDEWHEMRRALGSPDQIALPGKGSAPTGELTTVERLVLNAVTGRRTVAQLVSLIPLPSFQVLKAIHQLVSQSRIRLKPPVASSGEPVAPNQGDRLLFAFKQAYRHLLLAGDTKAKTARIITYCKDFFDQTTVLTAREGKGVRSVTFSRNDAGQFQSREKRSPGIAIGAEPIFSGVLRSGRAFFGTLFQSELVDQVITGPASGTCGLILLENGPATATFLLTVSTTPQADITPFHYLELLSWLIAPPPVADKRIPENGARPSMTNTPPEHIDTIVAGIEELPPMPYNVTRTLKLMADPTKSMADLAATLAEDQSMVARLIKVSNSALYRTGDEIRTLKHALTRLGTKTIRSLVLTASTRAMFPLDKSTTGIWSRALWQHAKECALASRQVARALGYPDPEEAFAGGMLHDVGKLVILLKFTDAYRRIRKLTTTEGHTCLEAEQAVLGFNHTRAGDLLMQKWHMPDILRACVGHHHHPGETDDKFRRLVHIVAYGNCLSNIHGTRDTQIPESLEQEIEGIMAILSLKPEIAEAIEAAVISDLKHADIFD